MIEIPDKVLDTIAKEGGVLHLAFNPKLAENPWTAGCHWGKEAEDSPMAAAAAYGLGTTPQTAMDTLVAEIENS